MREEGTAEGKEEEREARITGKQLRGKEEKNTLIQQSPIYWANYPFYFPLALFSKASAEQYRLGNWATVPLPGRIHQGCSSTHGSWFSGPDGVGSQQDPSRIFAGASLGLSVPLGEGELKSDQRNRGGVEIPFFWMLQAWDLAPLSCELVLGPCTWVIGRAVSQPANQLTNRSVLAEHFSRCPEIQTKVLDYCLEPFAREKMSCILKSSHF